jgi:hypothetical protein
MADPNYYDPNAYAQQQQQYYDPNAQQSQYTGYDNSTQAQAEYAYYQQQQHEAMMQQGGYEQTGAAEQADPAGAGAGTEGYDEGYAPPPPADASMLPAAPANFDENDIADSRPSLSANLNFEEPESEKNLVRDAEGRLKACSFAKLIGILTGAKDTGMFV